MTMVTNRFRTTGMHCPSCSMLIQMDISELPGVTEVTSDHRTGLTEVTYDSSLASPEGIAAAIIKAGYDAEVLTE